MEDEANPTPEGPEGGDRPDPGEIARSLLEELLQAMNLEATITVQPSEAGTCRLEMTGPEVAALIGRQGSTLGALQYLLSLIVSRRTGEKVRLILDAENYRGRREDVLRDTALTWAEKVKESGQECVLDPMSAVDRRIVHTALADDPDVYTYSEGEEPERCVVISPRSAESGEQEG